MKASIATVRLVATERSTQPPLAPVLGFLRQPAHCSGCLQSSGVQPLHASPLSPLPAKAARLDWLGWLDY